MKHLLFTPMIFKDYLPPQGFLPQDPAAHACFYFYMLAEKARETVGESTEDQRILEGEQWMTKQYNNQRRAVTMLYDLENLGAIDAFWPAVKLQAKLLGLPEPKQEYMRALQHEAE